MSALADTEFHPLRDNKQQLQNLEDLVPQFRSMTLELKMLREGIGNGEFDWHPGKVESMLTE